MNALYVGQTFTEFEGELLVASYWAANRLDTESVTLAQITSEFDIELNSRWVKEALSDYLANGLSREKLHHGPMDAQRVWLTSVGLKKAEALIEKGVRPKERSKRSSVVTIKEELTATVVPAANRLVDLSHNKAATELAIQKVSDAAEAIRGSNSVEAEVKSLWLSLLEHGRERLRKTSTYVAVVSVLLLKPLHDAYSSIVEESSKPIIEAAIYAVKALIGI